MNAYERAVEYRRLVAEVEAESHVHALPPNDADILDQCECGQLLCPDTETPVGYDSETGEYWHLDDTTCFLHQTSILPEKETT